MQIKFTYYQISRLCSICNRKQQNIREREIESVFKFVRNSLWEQQDLKPTWQDTTNTISRNQHTTKQLTHRSTLTYKPARLSLRKEKIFFQSRHCYDGVPRISWESFNCGSKGWDWTCMQVVDSYRRTIGMIWTSVGPPRCSTKQTTPYRDKFKRTLIQHRHPNISSKGI